MSLPTAVAAYVVHTFGCHSATCAPASGASTLRHPALATYLLDPEGRAYLPLALDVLTLRGDRIADVTAFRTPALFPRFGLPHALT